MNKIDYSLKNGVVNIQLDIIYKLENDLLGQIYSLDNAQSLLHIVVAGELVYIELFVWNCFQTGIVYFCVRNDLKQWRGPGAP